MRGARAKAAARGRRASPGGGSPAARRVRCRASAARAARCRARALRAAGGPGTSSVGWLITGLVGPGKKNLDVANMVGSEILLFLN